jgi:hypothetical protein
MFSIELKWSLSFGRGLLKMQLMLLKLVNLVTLWIPHNQENKLIITRSNLPFRENRSI